MIRATQLQSVEALLGLKVGFHASRLALPSLIESGLPVAALDHLAASVAPGDARFKFRLIPKAPATKSSRPPCIEGGKDEGLCKAFEQAWYEERRSATLLVPSMARGWRAIS